MALALWPAVAVAEDWRMLAGDEIGAALTARVLQYEDGTIQDFFADGRTLLAGRWGRWRVEGDEVCLVWPPKNAWECHAVEAQGVRVRFLGEAAPVTGIYADLQ